MPRPEPRSLGGPMARRQLHIIYVLDRSGSMNADAKIQSLNIAMTQALPLLKSVAKDNLSADVMVRAALFSDGARWYHEDAVAVEDFRWTPIDADGLTDLGAALDLVAGVLASPPMPERSLPPVIVLVSDGQPTDDYRPALSALTSTLWGGRALRLAIAIGHDADRDVLQEFMGHDSTYRPVQANDPEAIVEAIEWATTAVTNVTGGTALTQPAAFDDEDVFTLDDPA